MKKHTNQNNTHPTSFVKKLQEDILILPHELRSLKFPYLVVPAIFIKLAFSTGVQINDARLFCKNKQVNLKNKPKIGSLTEKQVQQPLARKFNKMKN